MIVDDSKLIRISLGKEIPNPDFDTILVGLISDLEALGQEFGTTTI